MQRLVWTQAIWAQGSCCHLYTGYQTTNHRLHALAQVTRYPQIMKKKRKWHSPIDSQSGAGREFSRDPSVQGGKSQTYLNFNSPEDLPNNSPSFPCALSLSFFSLSFSFPSLPLYFSIPSLPCFLPPFSLFLSPYSTSTTCLQNDTHFCFVIKISNSFSHLWLWDGVFVS